MAGQPDARGAEADGRGHVKKDDGQADGNAEPPIDDLVQVGVPRIVVAVGVAAIAVGVEHLGVQVSEAEHGRLAGEASAQDSPGEVIETMQIGLDIELRIVLERDQQRPAGEIVVRDLSCRVFGQLSARFGPVHEDGTHVIAVYPLEVVRLERTEAIVLHTFPARERDKVVVFLTPDHGKVKGLAYGARGIKSRFGASLEPLAKARIGYAEREAEELVRIESVELIRSLFPAQQDLTRSVAATYIAELVDTFAPAGDPAELIYRLLDRSAEALLEGGRPNAVVAYVEVWILRLAGIFPSTRNCIECGAELSRPLRFDDRLQGFVCSSCAGREAYVVSNAAAEELEAIGRLPVIDYAVRNTAADVLFEVRSLAGSIRRHFLGHELKSFEVLASVIR